LTGVPVGSEDYGAEDYPCPRDCTSPVAPSRDCQIATVETDKYVLSDGGMVRNIPVDVARKLCADVVIVVNLVEQEVKREKLQTATQLIGRSTDVMIVANENL
jgi:hypothetical protein